MWIHKVDVGLEMVVHGSNAQDRLLYTDCNFMCIVCTRAATSCALWRWKLKKLPKQPESYYGTHVANWRGGGAQLTWMYFTPAGVP